MDFGFSNSAFLVCTFWLIDALYSVGQKSKAKKYFSKVLKYSNHLGLFSEDFDLGKRELAGNFPQAYTHLGLIHAGVLLGGKGLRRPVCEIHLK